MEPAKIDWNSINSIFVEDEMYEHINAPQWTDLSAPHSVDDEAWFCRPDCNHPKTVEDFIRDATKLQRSTSVSEILPLGDRNRRDANLKRRGLTHPSISSKQDQKCDKFVNDDENQNPNFSTPSRQYNAMKAAIKSSTVKKEMGSSSKREENPRLRSTQSARNLFGGGRDILNQISEFCAELKRIAMRAKEEREEDAERLIGKKSPVAAKKQEREVGDSDEREKDMKPLLKVQKDKLEAKERSNVKEKQTRKKRVDDAENIPISVDLKNIKRREEESLLQIRTNPPSPQCFSAGHGPTKAAPLKASRCKPPERGILRELQPSNKETRNEEPYEKVSGATNASTVADKEARTLDVFWFLKPCAALSS